MCYFENNQNKCFSSLLFIIPYFAISGLRLAGLGGRFGEILRSLWFDFICANSFVNFGLTGKANNTAASSITRGLVLLIEIGITLSKNLLAGLSKFLDELLLGYRLFFGLSSNFAAQVFMSTLSHKMLILFIILDADNGGYLYAQLFNHHLLLTWINSIEELA